MILPGESGLGFRRTVVLTAIVLLPVCATGDRFAGAWKLNTAKSATSSWAVVRARNQIFQVIPAGYRVTTGRASITLHCDGKDRPDAESSLALLTGADTVAVQCVNGDVIRTTFKRAGKAVATMTRTVSADGTRMTVTVDGVTREREKLHSVLVYERR